MNFGIDIKGAEDIIRNIDALDKEIKRNAIKNVLSAGIRPVYKIAKALAKKRKRTGQLQKSIGISVKKIKGGALAGQYTARVGPRTGFEITVQRGGETVRINPVKYAHLVEYGTTTMPAKPFIRPAVDSAGGQALDAMAKALDKHVERALARRAKKSGLSK